MMLAARARKSRSGHAVVELALMAPWLFFLFVGALDFGFYMYSFISVQNAARVAALKTATLYDNYLQALVDPGAVKPHVCSSVRDELKKLPNFAALPADCNGSPLDVQVSPFLDVSGKPALRVAVLYETIPLVPIPGLLPGKLRMTRTASMRVYGEP